MYISSAIGYHPIAGLSMNATTGFLKCLEGIPPEGGWGNKSPIK
jgi:hypothetical protein